MPWADPISSACSARRTVGVPATVTLVAALLGGAALGILGAVVAIPLAATLRLWLREVLLPRLDRS